MPKYELRIFPSDLGWMALVSHGKTVEQLTFGHASRTAAKRGIDRELIDRAEFVADQTELTERLQGYAAGERDSFDDVDVNLEPYSHFQRRVLAECRRIPFGYTISYIDLAAKAGLPQAARAVGNCMAANRVPLIIPCHRVVCSNGRIGSYSGPGGTKTKRRLLDLERLR